MSSACTLVCDTRERHVTRHNELTEVKLARAQMTTGDYSINSPTGQILVIIERKSLDDYGASIKDGRHDNKNKLVDLRAVTGCRIMYIIEGPAFPNQHDTFSRIAYANIESSIFHLMIKDNITVLRTQDTLDTARTLVRFVRSMDSLYKRVGDTMLNDAIPLHNDTVNNTNANDTTPPDALDLLTARKTASDDEIARRMWSCFPGITVETSSEYMRKWSIADIVRKRVTHVEISALKTSNGRTINSKTANGLISVDKRMEIKLLSVVPGISLAIATTLLEKITLSALLSYGSEMHIEVISRSNGVAKRRLGEKLAAAITRHFNYKTPEIVISPLMATLPEETLGSIDDFLATLG